MYCGHWVESRISMVAAGYFRTQSPMNHRETNSLLRLFGTPRELLSKADSDLARLADALARGRQREAAAGANGLLNRRCFYTTR